MSAPTRAPSGAPSGAPPSAPPSPPSSAPTGVAAAARATADSLGQIDKEVAAAQGVTVDPSVLPNLATDLGTLHTTLGQWVDPIRPSVTKALQSTFSLDQAAASAWPVDRSDRAALTAFAASLRRAVGGAQDPVGQVAAQVAPLRTALDSSLGALASDSQAVSSQLSGDQAALDQIEEEMDEDEESIEEYHEDPFRYLLESGVDIGSIMTQLETLVASDADQKAAIDRAEGVLTVISQLSAAGGALSSLSTTVGALSTSLLDTQTALAQVANALADIVAQPPLPAILFAQLDAMVRDLKAADAIITELTGTH